MKHGSARKEAEDILGCIAARCHDKVAHEARGGIAYHNDGKHIDIDRVHSFESREYDLLPGPESMVDDAGRRRTGAMAQENGASAGELPVALCALWVE